MTERKKNSIIEWANKFESKECLALLNYLLEYQNGRKVFTFNEGHGDTKGVLQRFNVIFNPNFPNGDFDFLVDTEKYAIIFEDVDITKLVEVGNEIHYIVDGEVKGFFRFE